MASLAFLGGGGTNAAPSSRPTEPLVPASSPQILVEIATGPPVSSWHPALAATAIAAGASAAWAAVARRRRHGSLRSGRVQVHASGPDLAEQWFAGLATEVRPRPDFGEALAERGAVALYDTAAPSKGQEPWRYTDLQALLDAKPVECVDAPTALTGEELLEAIRPLLEENEEDRARLVFVDGQLLPELSSGGHMISGGTFIGGGAALRSQPDAIQERVRDLLGELPEADIALPGGALGCAKFAALNQVRFEDCACLCLPGPGETAPSAKKPPLEAEVYFISTGASSTDTSPRLLVDVGRGARLRLLEVHASLSLGDASLANGLCRVVAAEGADIKHDLMQLMPRSARFLESITAEVAAGASYTFRAVQSGARVARVNAAVALRGEGASCDVTGVMVASEQQQLDLHSLIHHSVPNCRSQQQQKNVIGGSAECIFKGTIVVDKEAQQTDSSQICRTLLLTKKAKVKAMPTLQIKADEVVCSHGASVTQLDEQQVFYMASRGLSDSDARRLLLVAFPQDHLTGLSDRAPRALSRVVDHLAAIAASDIGV